MQSKKFFAIFFVLCMLSTDFMIPTVLAGHHGRGNHGIELLLAAGILAKLLRKKGHHHHHHHGHHHHGHDHHGRDAQSAYGGGHGPYGGGSYGSGTRAVEVVHVAPPMSGYSSYPTTAQSSYGGGSYGAAPAATTSFSASIEYPFSAQSGPMPQHMPYSGPSSAASYIGYDPQPVQYMPPMPMPMPMPMPEQVPMHPQ